MPTPPLTLPPPLFCWVGGQLLVLNFEREGGQKKFECLGRLKEFLSQVFAWGELTVFLDNKRLHRIKYGFEGSISKFDFSLCVNQTNI